MIRTIPTTLKVAVAATLLLLTACTDADTAEDTPDTTTTSSASGDPILVGLVDEQTGPTAAVQGAAGNGVRLAVEAINDDGGINGREIELITKDTAGDAATTITAINELVDAGVVAILGPVNGGLCQATAPTFEKTQVPGFCLSPADLPKVSPYMYGIGVELAQQNEYWFDLMEQENGKVGILAQKTPVLDLIRSHVERFADPESSYLVEEVEPTATSARAQMQKLVSEGVGAILLAPCGPLSPTAAQEAIDLGYAGKIVVWNCFASESGGKAFAQVANGRVYTVAPTFILGDAAEDDPQKTAIDAYEAAGGPKDIVAAAGWDGTMVLAKVLNEGALDPAAIRAALEAGVEYEGVWSAGRISAADHRGARIEGAMRLVTFGPDGRLELADDF